MPKARVFSSVLQPTHLTLISFQHQYSKVPSSFTVFVDVTLKTQLQPLPLHLIAFCITQIWICKYQSALVMSLVLLEHHILMQSSLQLPFLLVLSHLLLHCLVAARIFFACHQELYWSWLAIKKFIRKLVFKSIMAINMAKCFLSCSFLKHQAFITVHLNLH